MANSIFLGRLNAEQRKALIERLWHAQGGKCFITGKDIDLSLHEGELEKQKRTWTLLRNGEGKWTSCRQLLISTQEILKPLLKLILTQGSTL